MTTSSARRVESALRSYADRGVLRGFGRSERRPGRAGVCEFGFAWHGSRPLRFVCDEGSVALRDFLPNMPARSAIYRDLKLFLARCTSPEVPEHRRLDTARAALRCTNRAGSVSLGLDVRDADFDHATRALVRLAHEVWLYLHSDWADYMWENFDTPLE